MSSHLPFGVFQKLMLSCEPHGGPPKCPGSPKVYPPVIPVPFSLAVLLPLAFSKFLFPTMGPAPSFPPGSFGPIPGPIPNPPIKRPVPCRVPAQGFLPAGSTGFLPVLPRFRVFPSPYQCKVVPPGVRICPHPRVPIGTPRGTQLFPMDRRPQCPVPTPGFPRGVTPAEPQLAINRPEFPRKCPAGIFPGPRTRSLGAKVPGPYRFLTGRTRTINQFCARQASGVHPMPRKPFSFLGL